MNNAVVRIPTPVNEPVRSYAPGSPERDRIKVALTKMMGEEVEIPAIIGGKEIRTNSVETVVCPHDHGHVLGHAHLCGSGEAESAIAASMDARHDWARMHWTDRAAIFLRAAELLAGPWRDTLNASTMLGQSKNVFQAEIDAACEMIDFLRFNVDYARQIYEDQPISSPGIWNQLQYRPIEGFVFAVTPFNFTSIGGNLPTAPALMGNTVVWKPATTALLSAHYMYKLLEAAGLPPGVINIVPGHGPDIGNPTFASPDFAGLHFTGSTGTFQFMWKTIGDNIARYKTYPRIVGETGGKDFIVAHPSADAATVATAIVRGGFEYQGQKCSAASRVYIPRSMWPAVSRSVQESLEEIRMGSPLDFSNFVNAVIDRKAFDSITGYINHARDADGVSILAGGRADDSKGYFIEPTVVVSEDPSYRTMCEEIFGPVVTVHVYDDARFSDTLALVDSTSPYALTGAIFSNDRAATNQAVEALENAAGNFYINDKPTGAVVGQQPFGGARASGTNDKAGSHLNLLRWVSARTIKETFVPPTSYRYPFHEKK